jgi:two-component system OmpR family response regulator
LRVLIVEDEKGLAESMRRGLVGEGFVVDVEHDGVSGLWAASEFSYDVAILDIMLPGMNGYQVLKEIREREIWTPVIMLTAKDGEYDQTDAFDLGADDYLTKPFSFKVLVARLRALIRRGAPERPNNLTVGSLVLDPARRTVTRRDDLIKLTAREFSLLTYLMRNAGSVVGKFDILNNVWDAAYEGSENVVEVYVGYLRKKIDAPYGLQTLSTDPRHGLPSGSRRMRVPAELPGLLLAQLSTWPSHTQSADPQSTFDRSGLLDRSSGGCGQDHLEAAQSLALHGRHGPPCATMISRLIANPRPLPPPSVERLASSRANRSNTGCDPWD